ncbi:hypothetical protein KSF78_0000675 [Schistosoma japonicum]|nr:hypothetical protein KSF78_0000675 [Schistosoma japonicum]KAH8850984.1 hypothetical protein KSF78_0000675 [Schistosoma japonicum]
MFEARGGRLNDSIYIMNLPCKYLACKIQACLIKNDYDETQCVNEINALVECCKKFRHVKQPCCEGWDNYDTRKRGSHKENL